MVYLADWKSAIEWGRQITDLQWEYGRYGLRTPEPLRLAYKHKCQSTTLEPRFFEVLLDKIHFVFQRKYPTLSQQDREILDFVIGTVGKDGFPEVKKLIYSTYPMYVQSPPAKLDLVALAADYEKLKPLLGVRENQ